MSEPYIHPSAEVAENVIIGNNSRVWINAQIRENATIGENCTISKDTYIDEGVSIGSGCKIQNSVSIYKGVSLANDVFIGPGVCFINDRLPRAFNQNWQLVQTKVEEGASIGANATIICRVLGSYCMVAAGSVVTKDVAPYSLVAGNPARHMYFIDKFGNKQQ